MGADLPSEVLFIGGRAGAGKSSVAFEVSRLLAAADVRHAVIEGDNLDQAYPAPWRHGIDLAEHNLEAMWRNYRRAGYRRLVFTNTVSVLRTPQLIAALGGAVDSVAVLLTAGDATAAARLARRETGSALDDHVLRSAAAARELEALAGAPTPEPDTVGKGLPHHPQRRSCTVQTQGFVIRALASSDEHLSWAFPGHLHTRVPR